MVFQSTSPLLRFRHSTRLALSSAVPVVTNTCSPTTIGEDLPLPGSDVFHAIPWSAFHSRGAVSSRLTPSPLGPRHAGQSSAASGSSLDMAVNRNNNTVRHARIFEFTTKKKIQSHLRKTLSYPLTIQLHPATPPAATIADHFPGCAAAIVRRHPLPARGNRPERRQDAPLHR